MRVHAVRLSVLIAILCMAILLASCSGERPTYPWVEPTPGFRPRTSVQNLLHNLHMAYDERNLTAFDSLLAEDYRFFFAKEDQDIADSLTAAQEHEIHTHMFGLDYVAKLVLSFDIGQVTRDTLEWLPEDDVWTMTITNVDLYVFGRTPRFPEDELKAYEMEDGRQRFWFRRNPWTDPATGDRIWTIVRWRELERGKTSAAAPDESTWGQVKWVFRP